MSDIIDSIKQGADQVLSSLDQEGHIKSAIEGLRSQWSEVDRRRRVSQLGNQIKTLQSEMKQLTEALGLQTLSLYDAGKIAHPELARLCERIEDVRSDISEKRAELTDIKAQTISTPIKCSQCQATIPPDAEFCQKCGASVNAQQQGLASTAAPTTQKVVRLRCPKCKTTVPQGAGFCPTCGIKLKMPQAISPSQQFCASCGAEMNAAARFCPVCGRAAKDTS